MSRFSPLALATFGTAVALFTVTVVACSAADLAAPPGSDDAGAARRDAALVDPLESGAPLDSGLGPAPSCSKYCELVMTNCVESAAQYASTDECLAFCEHLPLVEPSRRTDEKTSASVACRQYWADAPARTSPEAYCLAAGPFGGNTCGDRCTAYCDVASSACSADGGTAAGGYESREQCRDACGGFFLRDAGSDGGGESPEGPTTGDTFNCRLYWLRAATLDPTKCSALAPSSETCTD